MAGLLGASAAQFGADGYQHLPRYLEWLYRANPAGRGPSDCLVARQDGAIVGAMHRMILPLTGLQAGLPIGASLAVLHNHFIADALRSGPGVLLLRRAVKDVDAGFAPGVQAPLDEVYRRLGFVEHRASWLMKLLAPLAAAAQIARGKLTGRKPMRIALARLQARVPGISITAQPDEASIASLCRAMRAGPAAGIAVDWTPALVRWRFFDPLGPRHLLLSSAGGDAMAVVAFGVRRGLSVARPIELAGHIDEAFVRRIERVMQAAGAAIGLAFATTDATVTVLSQRGWRVRDDGTHSFRTGASPIELGPGATDVGFEAFPTEFVA